MNQNRIESFLSRVFVVILSTVLIFVVLELISRHFLTTRSQIEETIPINALRRPKPYVMIGATPGKNNLNELGYRGKAPVMPKNPGEFRVFVLGGSTVFLGAPAIPSLLQNEFTNDGHPNARVYNYGVLSSVSGMELARIVFEISDLQPDVVILYDGGNDIIVPWESDPRPGYPFNFLVVENNPLVESAPDTYPAFTLFAYGSNLFRYFLGDYFAEHFVHLNELRKQVQFNSGAWREKIADNYVTNVVKSGKVTATFGAKFMTFFQPLIFYKPKLSKEEQLYVQKRSDEAEYARDMRIRMVTRLDRASRANSLECIDLSGIYDKRSDRVFTDKIHTTDEAKRAIARAIYQQIKKDQLL